MTTLTSISSYISAFPGHVQQLLNQIDKTIQEAAPEAEGMISYGIPTYKMYGKPVVHFGGFKNHIGFYATPDGHEAFAAELSKFKQGKGSVQFPIKQPIPFNLITRIVKFRIEQLSKTR